MAEHPSGGSRWARWLQPLHSVRVRITLTAVLVTTVAVALTGWLLVRTVEDSQFSQLRDDITAELDRVAARLEAGDPPQDAVVGPPAAPFVQVVDSHGQVVAALPTFEDDGQTFAIRLDESADGTDHITDRTLPADTPPSDDGIHADEGGIYLVGSDVMTSRLETIARAVETPTGTMTVLAAAPVDQVARSVAALRRALGIGLPALVAVVAVVAWVLVGRALRPVEAIRAEVDEITGSTMHRRVPEPRSRDEIGRLARTMNAMLGRLDAATSRQRQFVSDASHELRSPVAAIRTSVEVALDQADRANWPAAADAVLAEESRLEALLDDLLLLAAHDENGAAGARFAKVDLTALVIAEAQRPRPVRVELAAGTTADTLGTAGRADQIARVVANLLDNAGRHARSMVRIGLAREDRTVRLVVDDDGPGIPTVDRERIFERFTRLDDSRTRAQGGTGLGLAVVRSIVSRHGGRVWADGSPLGGARFVVELPAEPPAPDPS